MTMVVAMAGLDASLRPFKGGNVKRVWRQNIEIPADKGENRHAVFRRTPIYAFMHLLAWGAFWWTIWVNVKTNVGP